MCNAYTVRPKIGALALEAAVSAEISRLPSPLVRRTGPGVVVPIHDRMLTVLDAEMAFALLRGETLEFTPYAGEIVATCCDSPLKRQTKPPNDELQPELF